MSRSTPAALVTFALFAAAGCGGASVDVPGGAVADEDVVVDEVADDEVADDEVADEEVVDEEVADEEVADQEVADEAVDVEEEVDEAVDDQEVIVDDTAVVTAENAAGGRDEDPRFRIRFATYNVRTSNLGNGAWGDTHIGFDANDAARMRRVAETIAAQHLTVVALQEGRRAERTEILRHLADRYEQRWATTTQNSPVDDTLVMFDKAVWRKVRETHYRIPLQPGRNDREQVGVLLEHKATGERVWFYSIHLAAHDDGEAARREGMRRTVASIREHAVARGLPFVLGGDFNSVASGAVGDILREAGFAKNTRAVADTKVGEGCSSFNGRAGSGGHQSCPGGTARHIDQVWVSRVGLQVVKYQVTATALTSRASDHNPLTTILRTR